MDIDSAELQQNLTAEDSGGANKRQSAPTQDNTVRVCSRTR